MAINETEPNSTFATANPAAMGLAVTGQLATSGDLDLYKVTLISAGTLSVIFDVPTNSTADYFKLGLYNSGGSMLSLFSTGVDKTYTVGATAGGNYYVGVSSATYYSSAQYSLTVTNTAGGSAGYEAESNNTLATANSLTLATPVVGQLSSDADQDWYAVTASSSGGLTLNWNGPTSDVYSNYVTLSIYDAAGVLLGNYKTGTDKAVSFGVTANQTYYIGVASSTYFDSGQYSLIVAKASGTASYEHEGNDTRSTANVLALATPVLGQLSSDADQDWYAVTASSSGGLTLNWNGPTSDVYSNYVTLSIYDAAGVLLGKYQTGTDKTVSFGVTANQTYYIGVASSTYFDSGQYSLIVATASGTASYEHEGNDTRNTASVLALSTPVLGQLSSETDQDWYAVTASSTGGLTLNWNGPTSDIYSNYFTLSMYDATGVLLCKYQTGVDKAVSFGATANQTYYIGVASGNYSFDSGQYSLSVATSSGSSAYEREGNDTRATANLLALATPVLGQLSSATDQDWYAITPSSTGGLTLNWNGPTSDIYSNYVNLSIYDAAGVLLANYQTGTDKTFSFGAIANQTYYIGVASSTYFDSGQYSLSVVIKNALPTGMVSISGTPTQGQTLTVSNTIADADGLGAITYQWWSTPDNGGTWIKISSGNSIALTESQVGKQILVQALYIDGRGTRESPQSSLSIAVANVNDAPTGTVSISGTFTQGQTLTANNTITDADGFGTITYQWWSLDNGVTWTQLSSGSSITLTESQVGKQVLVQALYTDGHGTAEKPKSSLSFAVANINDAPTGGVTISGNVAQGETLSASNTLADADGLGTITYQWQCSLDGLNWTNAKTGLIFALGITEVGQQVRVIAGYTDGHGTTESVSSASKTAVLADVAGSIATTASIAIGGAFKSDINFNGDQDFIKVQLVAGNTYQFDLKGVDGGGGTLTDPWLKLLNSNGTVLRADDDGATPYTSSSAPHLHDSQIVFAPEESGTFFLNASQFLAGTGSYTFSATQIQSDSYFKSLLYASSNGKYFTSWDAPASIGSAATVTYSFPATEPSDLSGKYIVSYVSMNTGQQAVVRKILAQMQAMVNITFVEVAGDAGDIRFATSDQTVSGGVTYPSTSTVGQLTQADVVIDNSSIGSPAYLVGSYEYMVLIHEIGHALGLKHPGNYNAGSTTGAPVPYLPTSEDLSPNTVMSYNSSTANYLEITPNVYLYAKSLMAFDIAALQFLYGGNLNFATGNDAYIFDANDMYCIWDAGGTDTIDASAQTKAVTLELQPGEICYTGVLGTDSYGAGLIPVLSTAFDTIIENAKGGSGNDLIIGNEIVNTLSGGSGNDTIDGAGGDDTLVGGSGSNQLIGGIGSDTAVFGGNFSQYFITSTGGGYIVSGPNSIDTLIGVEIAAFTDKKFLLSDLVFNNFPTGDVTIAGMAKQGQILAAANSLADADTLGMISYQWQAGGVDIENATGSTLVLSEAQVGKVITVVASYIDGHGTAESVSSTASAAVVNVNDLPTGVVTIFGATTQGQTLVASNTLADADGLGAIVYQWKADGVNIASATSNTFVPTETQVGKVITVTGNYIDGHGTAESVSSTATAPVANVNDTPTGAVTIVGAATQGQTLTASNTLADADGLGAIVYQWKADGVSIASATFSTFVPTEAQVGKVITVIGNYVDGHGTAESVSSAATAPVVNVNDILTGAVTISGTATQGETLTASNNLADADGLGVISYQWWSTPDSGATWITLATGSSLNLGELQVGSRIEVRVQYTDGHGNLEIVKSALTIPVASEKIPPIVAAFSPADDATAVAIGSNIVLTFSEAIAKGTGNIVLKTAAGVVVATYDAASSANLTIAGSMLTINPTADLGYAMAYTVAFAPGSIKDLAGNAYAGTTNYKFTTAAAPDTLAPTVTTFTPADEATAVAIGSNIVLTFSEAIARGTGNIVLKTAAGAIVATYDAASSANLTIAGSMLTINPTADLGYATAYTVAFAAGSIKDLAGNGYAGTTTYNFTTAPVPDTLAPTVTTFSPADEATDIAIGSNIVLTFSEAITKGTGNIVLKTTAGTVVATYDAASSANLTINASTLTINPTANLDFSTAYSVEFAPGSVKDLAGNPYAGTTTYHFTSVGWNTLTDSQLALLTPAEVAAITPAQMAGLGARLNVLGTAQFHALTEAQIKALTTAQLAALPTADLAVLATAQVQAITTAGIAALSVEALNALTSLQFRSLTTAQIAALTLDQAASLANTANIAALGTAQVAAITTADLAALGTASLNALSSAQFKALTTRQVAALGADQARALETADLAALGTAQIRALATAGLAALASDGIKALSAGQVGAFSTGQLTALGTAQMAALSSGQLAALSPAAIAALRVDQFQALGAGALRGLSAAAMVALGGDKLNGLTTAQTVALSTAQIAALSTAQAASLANADDIAVLSPAQVAAITVKNLALLTSNALNALTSDQFKALTVGQVAALTSSQAGNLEPADLAALGSAQLRALKPANVAALSTAGLQAMGPAQFAALTTAQIAALTPDQAASLANTGNIAALTSAQVVAISVADLARLSSTALNALGTDAFKALTTSQIRALNTAQINALEAADIAALSTRQFAAITTTGMAALSAAGLNAMSKAQYAALSVGQIGAITTDQASALPGFGLAALSLSAQLGAISSANIAALSPSSLNALSPAQFNSLSTLQLAALTPAQASQLETADLAALALTRLKALSTAAVAALTTDQWPGLSTAQIAGLTTGQMLALGGVQVASLSVAQLRAITTASLSLLAPATLTALTTAQWAALGTRQIAALGSAQIGGLEIADLAALTTAQVAAIASANIAALSADGLAALTSAQSRALTTAQIAALTPAQAAGLLPATLVALGTAQVAAITPADVAALSPAGFGAMSTAQFRALRTAQIRALTTDELAAQGTAGLAALSSGQIGALTTDQVSGLAADQLPVLTSGQLAAFSTAGIASLSTRQWQVLSAGSIPGITTAGIAALGRDKLNASTSAQTVALISGQVAAIRGTDLAGLTTAALNALTSRQFTALTVGQIAALTANQAAALETADLAALSTAQLRAITTADLVTLSTQQIASLGTAQLGALGTAQLAALTAAQRATVMARSGNLVTPLMLDLDGNGVQTLALDAGVRFDLAHRGRLSATGWVAPTDGLLVLDRNHNGVIDDGGELFGSATLLPDGSLAADGFAALAALDGNADGRVDTRDAGYAALAVWIDANSDGLTQPGELKPLAALDIIALHLDAAPALATDQGNLVGLVGSYDKFDGSSRELADVWLLTAPLAADPPTGPTLALSTQVSDMTQSLGGFTGAIEEAQALPGLAPGLLSLAGAAGSASPLQPDLSVSLAAQLSAFVDQNPVSAGVGVVPGASPPLQGLTRDLSGMLAAYVNGSVEARTRHLC